MSCTIFSWLILIFLFHLSPDYLTTFVCVCVWSNLYILCFSRSKLYHSSIMIALSYAHQYIYLYLYIEKERERHHERTTKRHQEKINISEIMFYYCINVYVIVFSLVYKCSCNIVNTLSFDRPTDNLLGHHAFGILNGRENLRFQNKWKNLWIFLQLYHKISIFLFTKLPVFFFSLHVITCAT